MRDPHGLKWTDYHNLEKVVLFSFCSSQEWVNGSEQTHYMQENPFKKEPFYTSITDKINIHGEQ